VDAVKRPHAAAILLPRALLLHLRRAPRVRHDIARVEQHAQRARVAQRARRGRDAAEDAQRRDEHARRGRERLAAPPVAVELLEVVQA
jgi:hypothetical protein